MLNVLLRKALVGLLACWPGCWIAASAHGDVIKSNEPSGKGAVVVYRMQVTPAAIRAPRLKHRLTVPPHKAIAANAVTQYVRCFGENTLNRPWQNATDKYGMVIYDWYDLETPRGDVPLKRLREVGQTMQDIVEIANRGAKCRDCDWGYGEELLRGAEVEEFMLPNIQQCRGISRTLALRTRLAVLEGQHEEAIALLRTNYQLGSHVGELRMIVASLVGLACHGIANEGMVDLIASPGAPNMYWPLAELRRPTGTVSEAIRVDSSLHIRRFPILEQLLEDPEIERDWDREFNQLFRIVLKNQTTRRSGRGGPEQTQFQYELAKSQFGLTQYTNAKSRLRELGFSNEQLEAMPVAKVLLLDAAHDCQALADEMESNAYLNRWSRADRERQVDWKRERGRLGLMIGDQFLPPSLAAKYAERRLVAQTNALQVIEALRHHAAQSGSFPESLDDCELELPTNPITDEAFEYQLDGGKAILTLPFVQGYYIGYRFEIELAADAGSQQEAQK